MLEQNKTHQKRETNFVSKKTQKNLKVVIEELVKVEGHPKELIL